MSWFPLYLAILQELYHPHSKRLPPYFSRGEVGEVYGTER